MLHDGFLNRFIIMDGSNMDPWQNRSLIEKEVPEKIKTHIDSVIEAIYEITTLQQAEAEEPNNTETYVIIPLSDDAQHYYDDTIGNAYTKGTDIHTFCKNDTSGLMREVSVRWRENALRLATAISAYELHHHVERETLEWCYTFIKTASITFLKTFMDEANQSAHEKIKEKAIQWFNAHHDAKNPWHTLSTLPQSARVFKGLAKKEREALIEDLCAMSIIEKSADEKQVRYVI